MTAYAIALLHPEAVAHADVLEYLERIQDTLTPFDGRFVVHGGGDVDVREGDLLRDVIVIGFPDLSSARAWYDSPEYQKIKPLRTRHLRGDVLLVEGVGPDHDPASVAAALREAGRGS